MSLMDDFNARMTFMEKTRVPDGAGGFRVTWAEGETFLACVTFDTSIQARAAEKQGVTSLYTVTTDKNVVLEYHDVLRRLTDGKIFRITSDGDDKATPPSATLNMRQVTAEEWVLTS